MMAFEGSTDIYDVTSVNTPTTTAEEELYSSQGLMVALVCVGVGMVAVLVVLGGIVIHCKRSSENRKQWTLDRKKVHTRYLKDYSVKTGGQPDEFTPTGSTRSTTGSPYNLTNAKNLRQNNNNVSANNGHQGGAKTVTNGRILNNNEITQESETTIALEEFNSNRDISDMRF